MEEFTDIDGMSLNQISNEVLESFGDRYSQEALRVLNTGILLPNDAHMVHLALAITIGLYMKKIAEGEFNEDRTLN